MILILDVENSNLFTNEVLKLLSKFSKVIDYKANIHKSIVFPFTCRKQLQNKMLEN